MSYLIDDVIYFDASGEFWAYNTSNNSGWMVKEINTNNTYQNYDSNPGSLFSTLMGDTIYFSASSGNASLGVELWAHDTSNGTTWRVGHTNTTGTLPSTNAFTSYGRDLGVIDDTIYFQAWGSGDEGMWAYNTSNTTMWRHDIRSGSRSSNPHGGDGETPLFRCRCFTGRIVGAQPCKPNHVAGQGFPNEQLPCSTQ